MRTLTMKIELVVYVPTWYSTIDTFGIIVLLILEIPNTFVRKQQGRRIRPVVFLTSSHNSHDARSRIERSSSLVTSLNNHPRQRGTHFRDQTESLAENDNTIKYVMFLVSFPFHGKYLPPLEDN